MPLVRISLRRGKTAEFHKGLSDGVYRAMRNKFEVPEDDRFVVIDQYDESCFHYSRSYLGVERSDDLIFIEVSAKNSRTVAQKQAFYAEVVRILGAELAVRVVATVEPGAELQLAVRLVAEEPSESTRPGTDPLGVDHVEAVTPIELPHHEESPLEPVVVPDDLGPELPSGVKLPPRSVPKGGNLFRLLGPVFRNAASLCGMVEGQERQ